MNKKQEISELKKRLKWVNTDKKFAKKRLKDAKKEVDFLSKEMIEIQDQIISINNLSKK